MNNSITFIGGSGLNLKDGGDAVKVIASGANCTEAPPVGCTSIQPDADNMLGATNATAMLSFCTPGTFTLCYQLFGSVFTELGSVTVVGNSPTSFAHNGGVTTFNPVLLTFHGGSGLDLRSNGDAAKAVLYYESCNEAPAGGSVLITDLGANDAVGAVQATAQFTFSTPGSYNNCYAVA